MIMTEKKIWVAGAAGMSKVDKKKIATFMLKYPGASVISVEVENMDEIKFGSFKDIAFDFEKLNNKRIICYGEFDYYWQYYEQILGMKMDTVKIHQNIRQ